jgi:hypothetical protein
MPDDDTPTLSVDECRALLASISGGATPADALAVFDRLPPMPVDAMLGAWVGAEVTTGHPLDGTLGAFHWHGKRFEGPEAVHPLVMRGGFSLNPTFMPLSLLQRWTTLFTQPLLATLLRPTLRLLSTTKPQARLRMTEFRGVSTATMVYDRQPINDVFRRVDDDTVLGLMDQRGDAAPHVFFFVLRRERSTR